MTSNIIDKIINKGVPISTPIIIRYCDLHDLCNDKEEFKKIIDTATKRRNERLSKIVSMEDLLIYKSMSIKIDPMTLKKELVFSSAAFLYSIMKYLNYENLAKLEDEEDFKFDYINLDFEVLLPRINRLRQIRDDHKLKKVTEADIDEVASNLRWEEGDFDNLLNGNVIIGNDKMILKFNIKKEINFIV